MEPFHLESHGARLVARFAPPRERPTLVFCHGFPGRNFNVDVAEALHARGYGTLLFRYRGAHGSEGAYGLRQNEEDIRVAVAAARRHAPYGLGLVGYSMGGLHAVRALAAEPSLAEFLVLQAAVADVSALRARLDAQGPDAFTTFLREGEGLLNATTDALSEEADGFRVDEEPAYLAPRLTLPALVVHGTRDDVVPVDQGRLLHERLAGAKSLVELDTDHAFEGQAEAVADAVDAFVRAHVPLGKG